MTDRDSRVLLARLVHEARRRANRRVLAGALAAAAARLADAPADRYVMRAERTVADAPLTSRLVPDVA